MNKILYYLIFGIWYTVSLLPMCVHYFFSDITYYFIYYVLRYRRKVVRKNLVDSFPEKSHEEIVKIEKEFYAYFCDYIAETVKFFSISEEEIRRRMKFENVEHVNQCLANDRSCSFYLGHYCNWEWISTIPLHLKDTNELRGQIYHPLENPISDKLFLRMRDRFGSKSISMDDTFRAIVGAKRQGRNSAIGYISDQVPGYDNIHYFTDFLNHDTPVFTGAERITRMIDAVPYYLDITRPKRGYYVCRFIPITEHVKDCPPFFVTEQYFRMLEKSIQDKPQYWLWSHNRWKRNREGFNKQFTEEERKKRLSRL